MPDVFNPDFLVVSDRYAETMNDQVLPFLKAREKESVLKAADGTPLCCFVWEAENPAGTVLVLHGFTENAFKYSELVYSLLRNNFSVLSYDQRGHGRSGRPEGIFDPSVTHVDRFDLYVSDLKQVCGELLTGLPKPWAIFAHSMGGAVAALFLEQYPEVFSAAALSSPMISPNTGVPRFAAKLMCGAACLFGRGRHYPFFMKPYSGPEDFETSCATDPARFAWYDTAKAERTEFRNSVPTYRWILESIGVTGTILAPGKPESVICPVLLSTAGNDSSVMPDAQERFIGRVPKGKHIFVKESRHEIFRSVNEVFFPWWHEVLAFLKTDA